MKKIIIIVSIAVLYLLIAIFGIDLFDNLTNRYILIDNIGFKYTSNKWQKIKIGEENFKKVEIYSAYTFEDLGKHDIQYNDDAWYYNVDKKMVLYEDTMFALKGNNMKLYAYKPNFVINDIRVKDLLRQEGLNYVELNLEKEIEIDLDNNGQIDVIYALSNVYSSSEEDILFSAIIVKLNGEYNVVKTIKNEEEIMLDIFAIIDVNNDKNLEIIITEQGFSLSGNSYAIYGMKNKKYVELIKS